MSYHERYRTPQYGYGGRPGPVGQGVAALGDKALLAAQIYAGYQGKQEDRKFDREKFNTETWMNMSPEQQRLILDQQNKVPGGQDPYTRNPGSTEIPGQSGRAPISEDYRGMAGGGQPIGVSALSSQGPPAPGSTTPPGVSALWQNPNTGPASGVPNVLQEGGFGLKPGVQSSMLQGSQAEMWKKEMGVAVGAFNQRVEEYAGQYAQYKKIENGAAQIRIELEGIPQDPLKDKGYVALKAQAENMKRALQFTLRDLTERGNQIKVGWNNDPNITAMIDKQMEELMNPPNLAGYRDMIQQGEPVPGSYGVRMQGRSLPSQYK